MKTEFLKGLGDFMTDDIINKIHAENGKDIEAVKAKLETANAAITDWEKKYGEVETKLKAFDGIDVGVLKGEIMKLQSEITTNQKNYETERAKTQRTYETNEFLSGYKFVNDYTKKSFGEMVNAALEDKANEGKNRKDIFETLIKDKDGKELENIFVKEMPPDPNPNKAGFPKNPLPPAGNSPEIKDGNPFDKKTFDIKEQVRIYKENPAAIKDLAAKAGYNLQE